MTKQHFAAIASTLAAVRENPPANDKQSAQDALDFLAGALADVFAGFNGRFDRERFLAAAGCEEFTARESAAS